MTGLEKCCITSAYLQWQCHSGERPVALGPLVICVFFFFLFFLCFFLFLICVSHLHLLSFDQHGLKALRNLYRIQMLELITQQYIISYIYIRYKPLQVSILHKSIAGRHRPVSYPDGPITARLRFIKTASWVLTI